MKRIITVSLALVLLSGCLRGESKSLDEVYQGAVDTYSNLTTESLPTDTVQQIESVTNTIKSLVEDHSSVKTDSIKTITNGLSNLLPHAGYTVRPAMTELRNQYSELEKAAKIHPKQIKLLGARTFSILSEELNSTKFSL